LFYQREGGAKVKLIPISAGDFLLEGNNNSRIAVVLKSDAIEGIKILSQNGTSRFYKKTTD